jgi:cytochrome c556
MRKLSLIAVLAAALLTPTVQAKDVTEADYKKAMEATLAGMQAIGKTLRENPADLSGAVAGAKAIDAALASIDSFWVARKDQGAVDLNAKSRAAAMAVAKTAGTNDAVATRDAVKALQGTCKACHEVHREQLPDKTYRIK